MSDAAPFREDALAALAWNAVDAWQIHSDDLDEAMENLRGFLKDKPEAVALGVKLAETLWK